MTQQHVRSYRDDRARRPPAAPLPAGERPPKMVASATSTSSTASFQALKNISLPLHDRKVTAFIGPSGCGKSTLLRVLNRIYDLYPGQRGDRRGAARRREHPGAGYRPQPAARQGRHGVPEADAVPDVDLRQHRLRHPPVRDACPKSEMDDRVEQALRKAALWDEVKDKLHQSGLSLSGGQQQRLCIARAIAVKPEVLLLDEPASALDPISTAKIEELIDELKSDYSIAIVTHNMQQAARASDYTAFMYLGELVEFGDTERSFTTPDAEADRGLHHRPLRLIAGTAGPTVPAHPYLP